MATLYTGTAYDVNDFYNEAFFNVESTLWATLNAADSVFITATMDGITIVDNAEVTNKASNYMQFDDGSMLYKETSTVIGLIKSSINDSGAEVIITITDDGSGGGGGGDEPSGAGSAIGGIGNVTNWYIPGEVTINYRQLSDITLGTPFTSYNTDARIDTGFTFDDLIGHTIKLVVENFDPMTYGTLFEVTTGNGQGTSGRRFIVGKYTPYNSENAVFYMYVRRADGTGGAERYDFSDTIDYTHTLRFEATFTSSTITVTIYDETTSTQVGSHQMNTVSFSGYNPHNLTLFQPYPEANSEENTVYEATFIGFSYDNNVFYPAQRKESPNTLGMFNTSYGFKPFTTSQYSSESIAAGQTADENPGWTSTEPGYVEVLRVVANGIEIWNKEGVSPTPPTPAGDDPFEYNTINWTVGSFVLNSDNYPYYPLTATGEEGVEIGLSAQDEGWGSDGKPQSYQTYSWKMMAPSAGWYQVCFKCKYSSSGAGMNFKEYNHIMINFEGNGNTTGQYTATDPDSGLSVQVYKGSSNTPVVVQLNCSYQDVPNFSLNDQNYIVMGLVYVADATQEIELDYMCSAFRIVADPDSRIILRKLDNYTPPAQS